MRIPSPLRWLPVLLVLALALPAFADKPAQGTTRLDVVVDLQSNGDARGKVALDFAPLTYHFVKELVPNPARFLRELATRRGNWELTADSSARYDDASSTVQMDLVQLAAARNLGEGAWSVEVDPNYEFINLAADGDRTAAFFYQFGTFQQGKNSMEFRGQFRFRLPAGASDPKWSADEHLLRYRLATSPGAGPAALDVSMQSRERLMTAIYKVYGRDKEFANMWVAKAILVNRGPSAVRDVRVRFHLDGYSEWSDWQRFAELVPGESAVARYHPVLDAKIARLTSETPADVRLEWQFTDLEGKPHADSQGKRTVLLGGHALVFQDVKATELEGDYLSDSGNGKFAATWVTPDDAVVKQFAAMASKLAGGVGAGRDNASTLKVLEAIYQLWGRNAFVYQHPPGLVDRSISFDPKLVQTVKYPRDVIRDKGGTCIDLAICYAAMANSLGIRPYLALRPGHCFPVFQLPEGGLFAVESTGATTGGLGEGKVVSFKDAAELAGQDFAKWNKVGSLNLVDVQRMWTLGASSPELESLPANILTEWGLSEGDAPAAQPAQPAQPAETPAAPAAAQGDVFSGTWVGEAQEYVAAVDRTITYPTKLIIAREGDHYVAGYVAEATIAGTQGSVTLKIIETFTGVLDQGRLVLKGKDKAMQNLTTGQSQRMAVDVAVVIVQNGVLIGRGGNDAEGFKDFRMQRGS